MKKTIKALAVILMLIMLLGITPVMYAEEMAIKGDVNNTGALDSGDATLILRHVVGNSKIADDKRDIADMNENGAIDAGDATLILRYVVNPSIEYIEVSDDMSKDVVANEVSGKALDAAFKKQTMRLAVDLFRASVDHSRGESDNVLISPVSIELALAMTANGANGKTRDEMQKLLGGNIKIEDLNEYLYTYRNMLLSDKDSGSKLSIANSIWFRDDETFRVDKNFLQTNANYYGAQAYKRPFDDTTKDEINAWVNDNTDGMIDKIIDEMSDEAVMYLVNALAFDAEWSSPYVKNDIREGVFTNIEGNTRKVEMMWGCEYKYISDERATGFIKDYKGGKYSFVALLPNEDVNIYDYIAKLDATELQNTLKNVEREIVNTGLPKFSYAYDLEMNTVLSKLGMPTAFDRYNADFSRTAQSVFGNLYISRVLHKTFISVDELGTKAGAATIVEEAPGSAAPGKEYTVILNRPFVYMIIDNETRLPIFMGAVTDIR